MVIKINNIDFVKKYNLDTLEESIIEYLYKNINIIKKLGIRKVAKDNFTSTATLYKLANKLGFDGYSDMIHNLYYTFNIDDNKSSENQYINILDSIKGKSKAFNDILNAYKDKQIIVTGMGFSDIIAKYISERLFVNGYKTSTTFHLHLLSKEYSKNVLLIMISKSGETGRMIELAKEAKENGVELVSFTNDENSKLSKLSTLSISTNRVKKFIPLENTPEYFFGEALLSFEYLLNCNE